MFVLIVFGQLKVIPWTKSKFAEIVAVTECYLMLNYKLCKKISKKQPFSNVSENWKKIFALNLQTFSGWARWLEKLFQVEYKLKVKYLENLAFKKFCYLNDVK